MQLLGGPPDQPGSRVVAEITYVDAPLDPIIVDGTTACVMFHSHAFYAGDSFAMTYSAFTGTAAGAHQSLKHKAVVPRTTGLEFTVLLSGGCDVWQLPRSHTVHP